jgi:hypothetical protein
MMDPNLASLLRFAIPALIVAVLFLLIGIKEPPPPSPPRSESEDLADENRELKRELRKRRSLDR